MYYLDLTPYEYTEGYEEANLLNVGWLEQGHDFPTGKCPKEFLTRLLPLCLEPIELYRGFHDCDLIGCKNTALKFTLPNGEEEWLGNGEIEIAGENGKSYRAPSLIYHYIAEHKYLPPPEFIAAVLLRKEEREG